MRISIDADFCQGHGQCHRTAPQLFDLDDDGRGVVRLEEPGGELADLAHLAVDGCPEQAISVTDWPADRWENQ